MKRTRVWCVVYPDGTPLLSTVSQTELGAIDKWCPNQDRTLWDKGYRFGCRCVRCTLTEEE